MTMQVMLPGHGHFIEAANAANVEHILTTNFENYPKGQFCRRIFSDLLESGILNADGNSWKVQRRVASPVFSTRSLRDLALGSVHKDLAERLLPILESFCDSNAVVDLQELLLRFTFDSICQLAFGTDPGCLDTQLPSHPFPKAFDDAVLLSTRRALAGTFPPWQVQKLVNVGSERRLRRSLLTVDAFALGLIETRRGEPGDGRRDEQASDLLSKFIEIADALVESSPEVKQRMEEDPRSQFVRVSDLFLRDIVISFILAGRDSSACGLTWFFWLLSSNSQSEAKICTEMKATFSSRRDLANTSFTFEELKEMHYLEAALPEAMRLYPRLCAADVWPDGTAIAKGTITSFNLDAMGRNASIWGDDCLQFRPGRFLSRDGVFVPPSPFGYSSMTLEPK